jgi:hypothetical protein
MLHTPQNRKTFVVFTFALILSQPLFSFGYYVHNSLAGAYAWNGDSIAIPIFVESLSWLVWMPIVLTLLWRTVFKRYPGAVSLSAWNSERPVWSLLWTILFALLLAISFSNIPYDWRWRNPFGLVDTALWTLLYAQLRAVIVAKPYLMVLKVNRQTCPRR